MEPLNMLKSERPPPRARDGFAIFEILVSLTMLAISVVSVHWYVRNLAGQKARSEEMFAFAMFVSGAQAAPKPGSTFSSEGIQFEVETALYLADAQSTILSVRAEASDHRYKLLIPQAN